MQLVQSNPVLSPNISKTMLVLSPSLEKVNGPINPLLDERPAAVVFMHFAVHEKGSFQQVVGRNFVDTRFFGDNIFASSRHR
jgi:hypothetical protein